MGSLVLSNNQNLNQSGFSGYGSILTVSRRDANEFPGSFVGALMGITAINVRTNVIPSYHMRSKGRFQSFAPGLRDGGEIAAAVNWLPGANDTQGQHAAEWSLLRQATLESNELTRIRVFAPDPDLHLIRVDGFLTQLGPFSYQPEAIMSGQVGWKIVGAPDIITPLVYNVSGFTSTSAPGADTAGTHYWAGDGSSSANTPGSFGAAAKVAQVSEANASESGSVATSIFVDGAARRSIAVPVLKFGSGTNLNAITLTIEAAGLPATAVTNANKNRIWYRLYIPGQYELWGTPIPDVTTAQNTPTPGNGPVSMGNVDGGSDAERAGFMKALIANGGECFMAIYGSGDTL